MNWQDRKIILWSWSFRASQFGGTAATCVHLDIPLEQKWPKLITTLINEELALLRWCLHHLKLVRIGSWASLFCGTKTTKLYLRAVPFSLSQSFAINFCIVCRNHRRKLVYVCPSIYGWRRRRLVNFCLPIILVNFGSAYFPPASAREQTFRQSL